MPRELGVGVVLVRVLMSGICASQVHEIDGRKGPDPYLPHGLGHEAVGVVEMIGPGVKSVQQGDTVVLHWRPGEGIQGSPGHVRALDGLINVGPVTAFSEYTVVSENRATVLPEEVPLNLAPLLGCALTTGFGAVTREAQVRPGESAVIIGFGGIGISLLKSLRLVSATPVCVIDKDPAKTDLARRLGADAAIISSGEASPFTQLVENELGRRPDVVFEATGVKELIEASISMTHENGRTVLIGVPDTSQPAEIATLPLHLGKSLIGSHGGHSVPETDIPTLAGLIGQRLLNLRDIPLAEFRIEEINSAIEALRAGQPGRAVISFI